MTHTHILLDTSLKLLAEDRKWKEYNSLCNIRCNNTLTEKVNLKKIRNLVKQELLQKKNNLCAICLVKYNVCVVC
jgi:hypothetical protein